MSVEEILGEVDDVMRERILAYLKEKELQEVA